MAGAGGSPLPRVGRFLPRRPARLCSGSLEHQVERIAAKTLGHSATASSVARRTEGVRGGGGAVLSGKTRQGLDPRTGLPGAQGRGRASRLREGASGQNAHRQRHDGERDPPRGQHAAEGTGYLLARRARRANAVVANLLQVETLASPDEQSLCDPDGNRRIAPTKPSCSPRMCGYLWIILSAVMHFPRTDATYFPHISVSFFANFL